MKPERIGKNVRTARELRQLSLQDLSNVCGFSKGYLCKIEHGTAQAPIATLMKIAKALRVQLNDLFDGIQSNQASSILIKKKDREIIPASKERPYAYERLAVGSQGNLTPFIIHIDDSVEENMCYQHQGEEIIHMLNGQCQYRVGDHIHHLKKGDTLTFNAQEPHGPIAIPGHKASYLAIFSDH